MVQKKAQLSQYFTEFAQRLSGHINIDPKLCVNYQNPSSCCILDSVLTFSNSNTGKVKSV